jgi:hypothetical protein
MRLNTISKEYSFDLLNQPSDDEPEEEENEEEESESADDARDGRDLLRELRLEMKGKEIELQSLRRALEVNSFAMRPHSANVDMQVRVN